MEQEADEGAAAMEPDDDGSESDRDDVDWDAHGAEAIIGHSKTKVRNACFMCWAAAGGADVGATSLWPTRRALDIGNAC